MLQEEQLAIGDAGQTGTEAAGIAPLVLIPNILLVAFPVLAIRRIGNKVIETACSMAIGRESAAKSNIISVTPGGILHKLSLIHILTFEIPSHDNDVQFIAITEPSGVLYSTNQYNIKGKFKNIGNNALTSFTIKYKINGVEQTPFTCTETILTDEVREITFATDVTFSTGDIEILA